LFEQYAILGPGAISYAGPGVLERVAERRVLNDWGLSGDWTGYTVLVAPANCALLGRDGWLITSGSILSALSVDCEQAAHAGQMDERGLLLDTNQKGLTHQEGWLILK
jgi:hypothetical protein